MILKVIILLPVSSRSSLKMSNSKQMANVINFTFFGTPPLNKSLVEANFGPTLKQERKLDVKMWLASQEDSTSLCNIEATQTTFYRTNWKSKVGLSNHTDPPTKLKWSHQVLAVVMITEISSSRRKSQSADQRWEVGGTGRIWWSCRECVHNGEHAGISGQQVDPELALHPSTPPSLPPPPLSQPKPSTHSHVPLSPAGLHLALLAPPTSYQVACLSPPSSCSALLILLWVSSVLSMLPVIL